MPLVMDNFNVTPGVVVPGAEVADNFNVSGSAPGTVTGLSVVPSITSLAISWNAAPGASYYQVMLTGLTPSSPAQLYTTTATSIVITGLTYSSSYLVAVVSGNSFADAFVDSFNDSFGPNTPPATLTVTTLVDPTHGGTNAPPPVVVPVTTIVQPLGNAFPAGYAFRPANFGKTASQVTA